MAREKKGDPFRNVVDSVLRNIAALGVRENQIFWDVVPNLFELPLAVEHALEEPVPKEPVQGKSQSRETNYDNRVHAVIVLGAVSSKPDNVEAAITDAIINELAKTQLVRHTPIFAGLWTSTPSKKDIEEIGQTWAATVVEMGNRNRVRRDIQYRERGYLVGQWPGPE